ncbi:hypothetical protein RhiXN_08617 [Rhizoctonia solani]|uniref:Uncharacterized protein n=1 Tax=Rhizoctonia solani TaxID=456999 RepID=A0A8H8P0P2_9AGAM|nr:uncharacterized protein RhiXN_08617 [Rhizoctonia solani]QRW23581.1 hypothetical protein RhiXN_08617 [Rhizoctonia solani]
MPLLTEQKGLAIVRVEYAFRSNGIHILKSREKLEQIGWNPEQQLQVAALRPPITINWSSFDGPGVPTIPGAFHTQIVESREPNTMYAPLDEYATKSTQPWCPLSGSHAGAPSNTLHT